MEIDRNAEAGRQLLDGGEILTCTFATMDVLRRAVAAELGEDDGERYGLASGEPDPEVIRDTGTEAVRPKR